jgi:formylglycine-generating enzyme required for sulfatase activity
MAGNAREWVADWYDEDHYHSPPVARNPQGPDSATFRVMRGGSFLHDPAAGRCAHRDESYPISRNGMAGFRVVMVSADH